MAELCGDAALTDALIRASTVGKKTREALYVHRSALPHLPLYLRKLELRAKRIAAASPDANIIKFHRDGRRISFLSYPEFETDPHPALETALTVDLSQRRTVRRDYSKRTNPPILHRKETFVAADFPKRELFGTLTKSEEAAGLLSASDIGTRNRWLEKLRDSGLEITGHRLLRTAVKSRLNPAPTLSELVENSHKTAIERTRPSRPARHLTASLLDLQKRKSDATVGDVLDFGCGHGTDVAFYRSLGLDAAGYDPFPGFNAPWPDGKIFSAVSMNYVLNVLPAHEMRLAAIKKACAALAPGGSLFVVTRSPQSVARDAADNRWTRFADGYVSSLTRRTFQKGIGFEEIAALAAEAGLRPITVPAVVRPNSMVLAAFTKG